MRIERRIKIERIKMRRRPRTTKNKAENHPKKAHVTAVARKRITAKVSKEEQGQERLGDQQDKGGSIHSKRCDCKGR
jgi:hypothetical protein